MNIEEIFKKASDSANPKFEIVIGKSNNAEAKIAGITQLCLFLKADVMTPRHTFYFQLAFLGN